MYQRILVPLDGSELAERALPHALELARCTNAELVLLRVPVYAYEGMTYAPALNAHLPYVMPDEQEDALRATHEYLDQLQKKLSAQGFRVSAEMREGGAAEAITDFARQAKVDLIVMATHGRGGLRRMFYGSVAERVLKESDVPVMLVRVGNPS